MLKYMPDTNIEIYTMKKKPALVRAAFKKHDGRMGNSSITSITEPSLLRHRERSVAIHQSDFMDYPSRVWTATSAVSLLAVTENKGLASSRAQRGDPFTDPALLRPRERSVVIHY